MSARDEIAKVIQSVTDLWDEPLDEVHDIPPIVDALLASPAFTDLIREAKREAWIEGWRRGAWDVEENGWESHDKPPASPYNKEDD